jgi:hypothetical protein
MVHNLFERPPVRFADGLERAVSGIPDTEQTSQLVTPGDDQRPHQAGAVGVQSGAAVVYVREALTTFFDPYSQIANNIYQFVAKTRLALATPRVGAINLLSGLPTS